MIIYLADTQLELPFLEANCTGYIAQRIEITADDVKAMREKAARDPEGFLKCMFQLEYRFASRRLR